MLDPKISTVQLIQALKKASLISRLPQTNQTGLANALLEAGADIEFARDAARIFKDCYVEDSEQSTLKRWGFHERDFMLIYYAMENQIQPWNTCSSSLTWNCTNGFLNLHFEGYNFGAEATAA